ncbi:MAG: hypothetical protein EKK64_06940 [Neisseriaceae bacterium]|nr:MAG: hypothetical protein EKK64_06940 [Neisseriaceae bacterium]
MKYIIFIENSWYKKYKHFLYLFKYSPKSPLIIWDNGTKEWHNIELVRKRDKRNSVNLTYHRLEEDGPAVIYSNGDKEWWFNGKRHRNDGPAVTYGNKEYWFHYGEFRGNFTFSSKDKG